MSVRRSIAFPGEVRYCVKPKGLKHAELRPRVAMKLETRAVKQGKQQIESAVMSLSEKMSEISELHWPVSEDGNEC